MKNFFKCVILLTMAVSPSKNITASPADLAATLRPLAEKYELPGVVGAIIHGDQVVALGSVGVRKIGETTPFLPGDIIHLGSDTKAMTAILIGRLIDEKRIAFD